MLKAVACMMYSVKNKKEILTSRQYDICKKAMSDSLKIHHHKPFLGKKFTPEHCEKISDSLKEFYKDKEPREYSAEEIDKRRDGWYNIPEEKRNEMALKKSGIYEIEFTNGNIIQVTGITKWLKDNGYNQSGLNARMKHGQPYRDIKRATQIGGKPPTITFATEETKQKIRNYQQNRPPTSLETRKKISEAGMGHPAYENQIKATKKTMSCEWKLTFPDGRIEYITSLNAWCKDRGINMGNLMTHGKSKDIECNVERLTPKYGK